MRSDPEDRNPPGRTTNLEQLLVGDRCGLNALHSVILVDTLSLRLDPFLAFDISAMKSHSSANNFS